MNANQPKPKYKLLPTGEFVIENYNQAPPFASFLPGVAGLRGIPLWCFYVNRGQGVSSFGVRSKDHAILEFYPANKAYQLTSLQGFRTFIKNKKDHSVHEPFQPWHCTSTDVTQEMRITSHDFKIAEVNRSLGLELEARYFTIPNEPFAALARILTIKNIGKQEQALEILDGLPQIVPYGMNNWLLKHMSRTAEAWVSCTNLEETGVPYFKFKVEVSDTPQVIPIHDGHFYLQFLSHAGKYILSKVVIDPTLVFGSATDFVWPQAYARAEKFALPPHQATDNRTACAFGLTPVTLKRGETAAVHTIIGHMRSEARLNSQLPRIAQASFFAGKEKENREVIEAIQSPIDTRSASPEFDHYCRQSYLDNVLRGGLPHPIPTQKGPFVFHVYWRKHGDLERDYNNFEVMPTYFAQGNANYRDVNQNRRLDPWFNPDVGHTNLHTFLNMIQLDGFNPLVLKSARFHFTGGAKAAKELQKYFDKKDVPAVFEILKKPHTPGTFLMELEEKRILVCSETEKMLGTILSHSEWIQEIDPGEGFWIDHWHYNLDMLENYFSLFPEKWRAILVEDKKFNFYDSPARVRPRAEKYVLDHGRVRQFHSIAHDKEKEAALHGRPSDPYKVRTRDGKGEIYHCNLLTKLLVLLVNKLASLDPFGVGIEMEAERPNWYDALNGLPGLFGSSVSEAFELKRLIGFLKSAIEKAGLTGGFQARLPDEAFLLCKAIEKALSSDDFQYWDQTTTAKEIYREKTRLGIQGKEKAIAIRELQEFLNQAEGKVDRGLAKAWSEKDRLFVSYFWHEATQHEAIVDPKTKKPKTNNKGMACVRVKQFQAHPLPLFLEGMVHALRAETDVDEARALHAAVRRSDLFDKKLGMYKVNVSIQNETLELGRARIFSPGWLENASIFMHMEFKYMLELLRAGLVEEFYADLKKALPAFMDPAVYGRSILENSTFIASSVNPDPRLHGRGFVARLSGTNAEWLHIWHLLTVGKNPFRLTEKGKLEFAPQPLLPGWLFTASDKTFTFRFLGKIEFTYRNPARKNTYGNNAVIVKKWALKDERGKTTTIKGPALTGPLAEKIRSRAIVKITADLG